MKNIYNLFSKFLKSSIFAVIFLCFWALPSIGQSQKSLLETEIYKLDNGLTIYLNEDHSLPSIIGGVAVKGGSKRDPADATGIAHYFEHIMFKGTDQIGTLDYGSEKVYLDSIADLYDKLAATSVEEEKTGIQLQINRLSIKASEYAIPNETQKILAEMGGTAINAGTSNEGIIYYNIFPANQVEKWLEVYSHRFVNPVYRLFQSELETVYEEYNMYKDDRFTTAFEKYCKAFYPDYPYGIPVIGYPEHLKNPSMKKMNEYFQTYYVANNMALILSGNFNKDEVKPMISNYFGQWRTGTIPSMPTEYTIEPLHGRNVEKDRLTPIKFGIRSYRSVALGNEDEPALDIICGILSNRARTGLMDDLVVNNKLMEANAGGGRYVDAGGEIVLFVPKIFGQSLKKAESLIAEKIEDVKEGKFDVELLEAVKTDIIVNYERNFEDQYNRAYMMVLAFMTERDWKEMTDYPDKINKITKDDIIKTAQKYYGNDYLVFYSKTGFPKKPKTLKPPFQPIPSANTELKSEYAKKIENMPVHEIEPDFIEFGPPGSESNEVTVTGLNPLTHLYYVENRVNNLFNLTIRFGIGTHEMPVLNQLSRYMELIGTNEMTLKELSGNLQKLGASYSFYSGPDNFNIVITGLDVEFDKILKLVAGLIYDPKPDDSKLKKLVEDAKADRKMEEDDPETLGYALFMYAVYGDKSPFINRLSQKDIKELKSFTLMDALKKVRYYEADIHYSGTIGLTELENVLKSELLLDSIQVWSNSPVKKEYKVYNGPVVFFLNDKKAIQSKNYFFLPGNTVREEDRPYLNAYAEYLDGGMQSIIFQEIREFRSLAYSSGANIFRPFYPDEKANLTAYVGTQADKTREAIEVMHHIISTPPEKSDRIDIVKKSLIQSINSDKPGFRRVSEAVASYCRRNYPADPRIRWVEVYKTMNFDDIVNFYKSQFSNQPEITTIIGDKSIIGTDWMSSYGKVIEVDTKDIFR